MLYLYPVVRLCNYIIYTLFNLTHLDIFLCAQKAFFTNCTNFIPNGFVNKESTFFVVILPTHSACVITNTYLFELFPIYNNHICKYRKYFWLIFVATGMLKKNKIQIKSCFSLVNISLSQFDVGYICYETMDGSKLNVKNLFVLKIDWSQIGLFTFYAFQRCFVVSIIRRIISLLVIRHADISFVMVFIIQKCYSPLAEVLWKILPYF